MKNENFLFDMVDNYVYNDNVMINSTENDIPANIFVVVEVNEENKWLHALSLDGSAICLNFTGKEEEEFQEGFCLELERFLDEGNSLIHVLMGRGEYDYSTNQWDFITLDPHLKRVYYKHGTLNKAEWENNFKRAHPIEEEV